MDRESKILFSSLTVVSAGLILGLLSNSLNGSTLGLAVLLGFGSPVLWYLAKKGYIESIKKQLNEEAGDGFGGSRDFKEMWNELQEWEQKDPRKTELVWHPVYTRWNTDTLPHTTDVDFLFVSLITPFKYDGTPVTEYPVHICFEAKTGFIIKHDAVKKKSELNGDPFKQVPLVKNARRQVYSTRQMMSRLRNSSIGRINMGDTAPIDETVQTQQDLIDEDEV